MQVGRAPSANRGGRELLDHGQEQFTVAFIEVCGIATYLSEEAKLFVGEFLRVQFAVQRVFCEELGDRQIESLGDLGKRVERRNGVSVFDA